METDNNEMCGDEIPHRPVDEDCIKMVMDDSCKECPMIVECYETNGYIS